eukprot:TRINITY_DN10623_c0_g1_i1.p1 TRINITY_DN10623_c0_g1~~TRINITY_DN10623_c0_g1_i1.p1  ORF type:complete len:120 (+),score=5.17 TRINITY_DN10623_c0_g1_i1:48-407(+)
MGRTENVNGKSALYRKSLAVAGALLGHCLWATVPAITRYLQTEKDIGAFTLTSFSCLLSAAVMGIPLSYIHGIRSTFQISRLWLFIIINLVSKSHYIYSAKFTLSVFVLTRDAFLLPLS